MRWRRSLAGFEGVSVDAVADPVHYGVVRRVVLVADVDEKSVFLSAITAKEGRRIKAPGEEMTSHATP
jgi:hypothetical protein